MGTSATQENTHDQKQHLAAKHMILIGSKNNEYKILIRKAHRNLLSFYVYLDNDPFFKLFWFLNSSLHFAYTIGSRKI